MLAPMRIRFICIHGHFYQPPRENPWLEAVETQDSAHPYHDWNERITAECYEPNASSRILDAHDRIVKIVNNYASISFNFGPTLLSWLELSDPTTYTAILDADRVSRERYGGHGSAIAQAYNHMILPLANARDKQTQVHWGVRDFEKRFGRKPSGMWLPETAVDVASLEALAAEGIAFTILEPHQAKTTNGAIDPTRPYRCKLPSGRSIAIFFYDGAISRAVAFERLLARGEDLAHRLLAAFSDSKTQTQLVNIATDGETYGHHHPHGDMALAYAIDYINERKLARIANYAQFLAENPPADDVDIVENTSWSCSHGVGRWRLDCGCNAGAAAGWNQQWRGPLRQALDWLRDECAAIFEEYGKRVLTDPWTARDDYIDVVLDRSDDCVEKFVKVHATPDGTKSVPYLLDLMEMQRNAMLMYTSCGWFFNDVSGIETVQVLRYAGRVLQLAEKISGRALELDFLQRIGAARSNLAAQGDARQIYEREVKPARVDLRRVAAHYAVASLFSNFSSEEQVYCYRVRVEDFETYRAGRARMAVGSIVVTSLITREESPFEFTVLHLGETELTGGVRPASGSQMYDAMKRDLSEDLRVNGVASVIRVLDEYFAEPLLSIRALFRDEQRRILNLLCDSTLNEAESAFRQLHERYDPLMRFHAALGVPLPGVLRTAAEFDVNLQLRHLLSFDELPLADIEVLLRESRDEGVRLDETTLMALKRAVERAASDFAAKPEDFERLERWEAIVSLMREAQVNVDLRKPQNDYYRMRKVIRPVIAANAGNGSSSANRWLQHFDALGEKLKISAEAHG
jgi:alpha-amylase/alpha-mannosidase (GH57 family)/glutathione S-transferase